MREVLSTTGKAMGWGILATLALLVAGTRIGTALGVAVFVAASIAFADWNWALAERAATHPRRGTGMGGPYRCHGDTTEFRGGCAGTPIRGRFRKRDAQEPADPLVRAVWGCHVREAQAQTGGGPQRLPPRGEARTNRSRGLSITGTVSPAK